MPIPVTCRCGKKYQAPEQFAGKKIRCKACDASIAVPATDEEDVVDVGAFEEDDEFEDDLPTRPAPPKMRRPAKAKPESKPKASRGGGGMSDREAHQQAEEQRERTFQTGLGMSGVGVILVVLPFFGFEQKGMGLQGTLILGGVMLGLGVVICICSAFISVKPARRSSGDDDDAPAAKVSNPGEMIAKIILWTILLAMLSIPALIVLAFLFVGLGRFGFLVAAPLLVLGGIGYGIYRLIARFKKPSAAPKKRRPRDDG